MPAARSRSTTLRRFLERLDAVDGALDRLVAVLHADAGAVDARFGQRRDHLVLEAARIDLDGEFGARRDVEMRAQRTRQARAIVRRQHGRRAAAPMDVRHRMAAAPTIAATISISRMQQFEIGFQRRIVIDHFACGSRRTSTACRKTERADRATAACPPAILQASGGRPRRSRRHENAARWDSSCSAARERKKGRLECAFIWVMKPDCGIVIDISQVCAAIANNPYAHWLDLDGARVREDDFHASLLESR